MNESAITLLDLPTEILHIIFKKLNNIDVLYSLFGVDGQRLNTVVSDITFTQSLNFVLTAIADDLLPICDSMLDRFCMDILPKIHNNVNSLTAHSESMERILLAADFPNLSELRLHNVSANTISRYFTDESPLRRILREQITDLLFLCKSDTHISSDRIYSDDVSTIGYSTPLFFRYLPLTTCSSPILRKLCAHVRNFEDCLALLDGRLKKLTRFIVTINSHNYRTFVHYKKDHLPNLKHFSLKCYCKTKKYDTQIVSLIRRMSNLEELTLNIQIKYRTRFVDGVQINNEILVHLPKLYQFSFHISTEVTQEHLVHQLSEGDIQRTLADIKDRQVTCTLTPFICSAICHVFSIPFAFDTLQNISHTCPSVIFNRVTYLSVQDMVSFEHEFFLRLACCFPMLKQLFIGNSKSQSHVSNNWNSNDNRLCSIAQYPYLIVLNLTGVHIDYVEEFLDEAKTRLPRLIKLEVYYEHLEHVTEKFIRDATRLNCANIEQLVTDKVLEHSKNFYTYFPRLSSCTCFSWID